jgi:Tol biopolymer transport system component
VHWFPDGQSLLVAAYRDAGLDRVDYYRIDVRSGEVSLIRRSEEGLESLRPDLSPDGKKIFFTHTEFENSGARRITFVTYDIETRQEAEIYRVGEQKRVWNVLLSPDGRQLAFIEWDEDTHSDVLKVMRAEGGSWTPDGRYLLVSKMSDLLRVPVGGGDAQQSGLVMRRIGIGNFHPDGRRITFKSGRPREFAHEIWVLENFLPEPPAAE